MGRTARRSLLLAGALAFVLSLVWDASAAILYGWFAPRAGALSVVGVSGTLGHGRASALLVDGRPSIENLQWRWCVSRLLLGRLQLSVDGGTPELRMHGQVYRALPGLRVADVSLEGSIAGAIALADIAFAPLSGAVEVHLDHAAWKGTALQSARGSLQARHVSWTLAQPPFLLGDFSAQIETTADGRIQLRFTPGAGPLVLEGAVVFQPADQSLAADLWMQALPNSTPLLVNLLHSLGSPDAQGRYHIQQRISLAGSAALGGPPVTEPAAPVPAAPMPTSPLPVAPAAPAPDAPAPPPEVPAFTPVQPFDPGPREQFQVPPPGAPGPDGTIIPPPPGAIYATPPGMPQPMGTPIPVYQPPTPPEGGAEPEGRSAHVNPRDRQ